MRQYLVKMRPLEPYTFGKEQGFKFKNVKIEQTTYFIKSNDIPEQTTVLGMLRYFLLKGKGILKKDFCYTDAEKKAMDACIGKESFCFGEKKQDFGVLKSVSPVFLINEKEEYLIKTPFCMIHKKEENEEINHETYQVEPMKMGQTCIQTSAGRICLPLSYNPKEGYEHSFFNLQEKQAEKGLISTIVFTGNRKNNPENLDSQEDGFFKREAKILKKGVSFAVFVEANEELPKQEICYMGLKKSAFLVTTQQVDKNDLEEKIVQAFSDCEGQWIYAYSDLVVTEQPDYSSFCIVEEKQMRNLTTNYQEKQYTKKQNRSNVQYNLIQSGSVFFENCPLKLENENCKQIGYNHIVRIGGNKKCHQS